MLHDKPYSRAMRATAKAVIKLLTLTDGKRRGFFVVKRAAGNIITTCFFKWNVTLDYIHNVETVEQIMNEASWNHPSSVSRFTYALCALGKFTY
ncbi:conserved hypothetical protein [Candidatus Nitrotoga sp. HW29]|nr:conserved hypothetical protein [Candidatus Nitrotoga sp. HW29]